MTDSALQHALRLVALGQPLSRDEAAAAFRVLMQGGATPVQSAALLFGLRARGERAEELAGAADALRAEMVQVDAAAPDRLVDTCGTGGGAVTTINVSTAAAFLVAAAGVPVAKHGNRSFTSKSGSADVLEALGIDINLDPGRSAEVLRETGLVFLFAPNYHPAMRNVAAARRELAVPTVMNLLGPLVNPAGARRQVVGVADRDRGLLVAEALALLGTLRAMVVHADAGMDEISPLGATTVWEVHGGSVRQWKLDPAELGWEASGLDGLAGGTPEENAARIEDLFGGGGTVEERNAILLNAAAAIAVSNDEGDLQSAAQRARAALEEGSAARVLDDLRRAAPRAG